MFGKPTPNLGKPPKASSTARSQQIRGPGGPPPSGPPRGINFSRLKLKQPLPPLPASTLIIASSTNLMTYLKPKKKPRHRGKY